MKRSALVLLCLLFAPACREEETPVELYPVPFSTVGERLAVFNGTEAVPFFIKGVNLGVSVPGTQPGEMAATAEQYERWFARMQELGVNVVRVYTLHYPRFYEALRKHNLANREQPLYVMHGVWLDEENPTHDLHALEADFEEGIHEVVDASHGRREIAARYGRASGRYTADISPWVIGWLLGREVMPEEVLGTNKAHPERTSYLGENFQMPSGSPTEVWWAEQMDRLVRYERETYQAERPVAMSSWLTLDPLTHSTEGGDSSEDIVGVDLSKLKVVNAPAGFFASYHAYPYYPDFVNDEPAYQNTIDTEGPNTYLAYLKELKSHYAGIPLLVAEFGVPSSWGNAHPGQSGMHQGGHDEAAQGRYTARMLRNIHESGYAGAVVFAWIDEWFKANWICEPQTFPRDRYPLWHNVMNPEQSYGLIAFDPPPPDFSLLPALSGPGRIQQVETAVNAEFFFLRLKVAGGIAAGETLTLGFDTYADDRGEPVLPNGRRSSRRHELALQITPTGAQLLVTEAYNLHDMWRNRAPEEQGFHSVATDGAPWVPVRWRNRHERTWRNGTVLLPSDVETGKLRVRLASAPETSMDAVVIDGETLDIRIPWMLLQFSDPSSLTVVDDNRATRQLTESAQSEGIAVSLSLGEELLETSRLKWAGWNTAPASTERDKASLQPFADALRSLQ